MIANTPVICRTPDSEVELGLATSEISPPATSASTVTVRSQSDAGGHNLEVFRIRSKPIQLSESFDEDEDERRRARISVAILDVSAGSNEFEEAYMSRRRPVSHSLKGTENFILPGVEGRKQLQDLTK